MPLPVTVPPAVAVQESAPVAQRTAQRTATMAETQVASGTQATELRRRDQSDAVGQSASREQQRAPSPVQSAAQGQVAQGQVAQGQVSRSAPPATDPAARSKAGSQFTTAADAATPAPSSPVAPRKAVRLAGYTSVEEESVSSVTRRRYISSAGTPLILVIVQSAAAPKAGVRSESAPEFVVRTANGTTAVRWTAGGLSYELTGALSPDSLVKLATQIR